MRRMRRLAQQSYLALSLSFAGAGYIRAQTPNGTPTVRVRGTDWRFETDSLKRERVRLSRSVALARADSANRSSKLSAAPIIGGAVIGGVLGLAVGYALAPRSHCPDCGVPSSEVQRSDFVGAGIGFAIGGGVGWFFSRR
jgi:hypothetical protein